MAYTRFFIGTVTGLLFAGAYLISTLWISSLPEVAPLIFIPFTLIFPVLFGIILFFLRISFWQSLLVLVVIVVPFSIFLALIKNNGIAFSDIYAGIPYAGIVVFVWAPLYFLRDFIGLMHNRVHQEATATGRQPLDVWVENLWRIILLPSILFGAILVALVLSVTLGEESIFMLAGAILLFGLVFGCLASFFKISWYLFGPYILAIALVLAAEISPFKSEIVTVSLASIYLSSAVLSWYATNKLSIFSHNQSTDRV